MRKLDDDAPITMDARSAVEPGTADMRISSTSSRERRCGDGAACSGTMPPRYTIRSTPARAAASPNASAIRRSRPEKSPFAPASIEWIR